MPGDSGATVVTNSCVLLFLHTRLRARLAPGIPHALFGRTMKDQLGRVLRCGRVEVCLSRPHIIVPAQARPIRCVGCVERRCSTAFVQQRRPVVMDPGSRSLSRLSGTTKEIGRPSPGPRKRLAGATREQNYATTYVGQDAARSRSTPALVFHPTG